MAVRNNSHTISHAENIFSGDAYKPGANDGGRGIPRLGLIEFDLGTPALEDVDGYSLSATLPAGAVLITGALAVAGVGIADVARSVQAVSANVGDTTQVLTITGTDIYGAAVQATVTMNGTTVVETLKAFKTITSISSSATSAGAVTIGSGTNLGLPYRIDAAGDLYIGNENNVNAVPAAGALVVADSATATAATGDVRGTYDPSTALDGVKPIKLIAKPAGRSTVLAFGVAQFSG